MIDAVLQSPLFGIVLSVGAYWLGHKIQRKTRIAVLNPLMLAIAFVIAVLAAFDIPLEVYDQGGDMISAFLAPATCVLGLSVYRQFHMLRKHLLPVAVGCTVGSAVSVGSVFGLCRLFGLDEAMTASLLPKSVTTPIALGISGQLGGYIPVTVAAVMLTGILGAVLCPVLLRLVPKAHPVAAGVSIGACSHALGTTRALQLGEVQGAMSGIAIGVCGLFTVLLAVLF